MYNDKRNQHRLYAKILHKKRTKMALSVCNRRDKNNQKYFQEYFFNWRKRKKKQKCNNSLKS